MRCKCNTRSYTRTENRQSPFCYAFVIVSSKNEILYESSYTGADAHEHFIEMLLGLRDTWLEEYFENILEMEPIQDLRSKAQQCFLCEKKFVGDDVRVRGE